VQYRKADYRQRREMLNEFCLTTGYNRKYAFRLLGLDADNSSEFINWSLSLSIMQRIRQVTFQ
jgi:hypothetical protein